MTIDSQVFVFLRTQEQFPLKSNILKSCEFGRSEKTRTFFVLNMLLVLFRGDRKTLTEKIERKLLESANKIEKSFLEIQNNLGRGIEDFTPENFSKTYEVIGLFFNKSKPAAFHSSLRKISFEFLPFYVRVFFYPNPQESLMTLRKTHNKATQELYSRIAVIEQRVGVQEEEKEDYLEGEKACLVAKVLSSVCILLPEEQAFSFGEAILLKKKDVYERLIQEIGLQNLLGTKKETPKERTRTFSDVQRELSTYEAIVDLSFSKIEENLGFSLPDEAKALLRTSFQLADSFRQEFCCLSAYKNPFYLLDLERVEGSPSKTLQSLQLILFFQDVYGVSNEAAGDLFLVIHSREDYFVFQEKLPTFLERTPLKSSNASQKEPKTQNQEFSLAWDFLIQCFKFLEPNRKVERRKLFQSPRSFSLLLTFLEMEGLPHWINLFSGLSQIKGLHLRIDVIYSFLNKNKDFLISDFFVTGFLNYYRGYAKLLQTNTSKADGYERLFLTPAIRIDEKKERLDEKGLEEVEKNLKEVLAASQVDLPRSEETLEETTAFFHFLRLYTFQCRSIVKMVNFSQENHFPTHAKFLETAIQEEIGVLFSARRDILKRALASSRKIQKKYSLSERNALSLLIEFVKLMETDQEREIVRISQFLMDFEEFTPDLKEEIIHFLYRYHPLIPQSLSELMRKKKEWVETDLTPFYIDVKSYVESLGFNAVVEEILSQNLGMNEEEKAPLEAAFRQAFFLGFSPFYQPLTDYCRVSGIEGTEIEWISSHLKTHWGQIYRTPKCSPRGIYFNWSSYDEEICLEICSFNFNQGSVNSKQLYLKIPDFDLKDFNKRKDFFTFFYYFAMQALGTEEIFLSGDKIYEGGKSFRSALETFMYWEDSLEAAFVPNLTDSIRDALWHFFENLKPEYRKLSLGAKESFQYLSPLQYAALGNISQHKEGASLLSDAYLVHESHPHFFELDVDPQFVEACRGVFNVRQIKRVPLNLKMQVTRDGICPEKVELFYRIYDTEKLIDKDLKEKETKRLWDGRALSFDEASSTKYVALSFKERVKGDFIEVPVAYPEEVLLDPSKFARYFEWQYLLLKAKWYRNLDKEKEKVIHQCKDLFSEEKTDVEITLPLSVLCPRLSSKMITLSVIKALKKQELAEQLSHPKNIYQPFVTLTLGRVSVFKDYPPEVLKKEPLEKEVADEFEKTLLDHLEEFADKCFPKDPLEEKKEIEEKKEES